LSNEAPLQCGAFSFGELAAAEAVVHAERTKGPIFQLVNVSFARLAAATNPKKKRRPAEANRHLPVNSRPLIELLMIGGHDRQQ